MEGPQRYLDKGAARRRAELESQQARPLPPCLITRVSAPGGMLRRILPRGAAAMIGDGYESDITGFEGLLTETEIEAIVAYLKSEWPERECMHQKRVTTAEEAAGG